MESRFLQLKRKLYAKKPQINNPDLLERLLPELESIELKTFHTNYTDETKSTSEEKDENPNALPPLQRTRSTAEVKEFLDHHLEKPHWRAARTLSSVVLLLGGSTADTWQFYDGMKDITGRVLGIFTNSPGVTWLVSILYLLQDITINRKFTNDGLDQMIRLSQGETPPDWEELPHNEERKARIFSFLTNAYAIFSDMIQAAYALANSGFASDPVCFIFGAISSLSNLPTEGVQNYFLMRSIYTRTSKAIENALKEMELNEHFQKKSGLFKKNFPAVWAALSCYLKIALQHPDNKHLLNKTGKNLSEHLLNIFNLNDKQAIQDYLAHDLKFDPQFAESIATSIAALNTTAESKDVVAQPSNRLLQILQFLDKFFKLILKIFGAGQDVIGSYVAVAAMFAVSSPFISYFVFILSLANGLNDACFGGEVSTQAIDAFKAALQKEEKSYQDAFIFCLSFFFAGMVGHAQLKFILDMLSNPDAPFPAPVAALMVNSFRIIFAVGAACRESINYCFYFYPIFETIVIEFCNLLRYRRFHEESQARFYLLDFVYREEGWLEVFEMSMEKHPAKLLQDLTELKIADDYFAETKAFRHVQEAPKPKPLKPVQTEGPARQRMESTADDDDFVSDDKIYEAAKTAEAKEAKQSPPPPAGLLSKMNFIASAAVARATRVATAATQAIGITQTPAVQAADNTANGLSLAAKASL